MPRDCAILRDVNFEYSCLIEKGRECNEFKCSYASKYFRFVNGERVYPAGAPKITKPSKVHKWNGKRTSKIRLKLFQRDGYKCLRCGTSEKLTFGHILAKSNGGKRTLDNGQTLCQDCNAWQGTRTIDFRLTITSPIGTGD